MPRPLRALTPERSPAHRLGAELRKYRCERGMTHADLARVVHVSASLLAKVETGLRISTEEVLRECDKHLGTRGELGELWLAAAASRAPRGRPPTPAGQKVTGPEGDLSPVERALVRLERAFGVRLERAALREDHGTIGARTDRGTWIRLATRSAREYAAAGWGGIEAAAGLSGPALPEWLGTLAWRDRDSATMWRADELAIVEDQPLEAGRYLRADPGLPESWWRTWSSTLGAFANAGTSQSAAAGGEALTDGRIAAVIARTWPEAVAARVTERRLAHGAMTWAKLTGPRCWLLGWSSWTRAPRGFDAATLWSCSLAVPQIAARIWSEQRADLESPSGTTSALYCLARILADPAAASGPTGVAAHAAAARLLSQGAV